MGLFISYSTRDRADLDDLLSALRRAREDIWFDEDLGGGEVWWQMICERIRGCGVFVFAMSDNSLESKACLAELRYAQDLGKPVLPIQIGPVESMRVTPLAAVEAVDFRRPTVDSGIRLITAVHEAEHRGAPLPSPLPAEPPVPYAYLIRAADAVARAEIEPEAQRQLLAEIEGALREDRDDQQARHDIARLLGTLRDRPDATPQTRADVDRLLASMHPTPADKPAGRSKKWLIAGAAAVILVGAAVTAVVLNRHRTAEPATPALDPTVSTAAAPTISTDRLASLLVDPRDVTAIMGASDMRPQPVDDVMFDAPGQISDPDCLGTDIPAAAPVYEGSGWSAVRTQSLSEARPDDPDTPLFWVQQAAVTFPSPREAQAFLAKSAGQWQGCSGRVVKEANDAGPISWTYEDLSRAPDTLSQKSFQEGGGGWSCQHALTTYANSVFEAVACGQHIDDEASRIVAKMQQQAKA